MEGTGRAARYRDVFANGEFRALWLAELVSSAGDQVARVALSVLVYVRTGSAALTAFTFALTFLPALIGPVLAGLADRYPRREVMIACDLSRGAVMTVMALPFVPLWVMFPLIFVAQLLSSPSNAARGALLADVLAGDMLTVGQGLRQIVGQIAQVGGFAVGGFLTAILTPYGSLAVNAASFFVSASIIFTGVRHRPAPIGDGGSISLLESTRRGARLVFADRQLRTLIWIIWMIGLPVTADGIAVPYASTISAEPTAGSWLLAATPVGAIIGAFVLTKLQPALRLRLMAPLAGLSGLPLLICVLQPNLIISCVLFGLSGVAAAYMVVAPATFIQRSPQASRGQAIGLMTSGYIASQGICLALGGVIADRLGPAGALGVAGAVALVLGAALTVAWRRVDLVEVSHGPAGTAA
ncbi:MFS transporter [Kutzneria kofuensis]|uniref:MFS family permease n=1 Tax=Kutzneria kofuensis TaxID=103725 RepID=A0A7W9KIF9_9PSEU|nr:MFS transporter [Kutzneria kofuensis]MBB5892863.1 MFS family permease [Kutzneria kofuensis]